jgi:hypothetical protein
MKRVVCLSGLLAALVGCSSMSPQTAGPTYELDQARMALVERAALRTGVGVRWINPPTKIAPAAGSAASGG